MQLSKLISYLFHPIFIPIMGTLGYFFVTPRLYNNTFIYGISISISIFTVFAPMLFFMILKRLGIISSIFLSDVKERKVPLYLYIILLYVMTNSIIKHTYFAELHYFFVASLISIVLCLLLVFFKIKASMHVMGISGLTIFLILMSIYYQKNITFAISVFIFLTGAIASARLILRAHTPKEVILGLLAGSIPQLASFLYW